jgi:hypothetical protein
MALILLGGGTEASGVDKAKREQAPYALITGTVFRETGLAFPGVELTLAAAENSKEARKFKKMRGATSPRGEFVLRVPAAPMNFTLTAKAPGYQAQEKPVTVTGEDRIDVFFRLEPASK